MEDSDSPVLELAGAGRRFGSRLVLHPVSLRVARGTVCLVHGANGSGKTTLLRVAAGLLSPSVGSRYARERAVYLRPGSGARARQRVADAVRAAAVLATGEAAGVASALARAGLADLADRRVGALSAGQRARLLVALAVVTQPGIACLDEPTAHLDDAGAAAVWTAVRDLADAGCAVLVATPNRIELTPEPDARLRIAGGTVGVDR
ncbi:ATP-binding cassette domain-containing protein [Pseudonocardia sp. MH-G8]|uniref:ABC transporter ATP-binding protein n=1 Tax=Pseudonocardia sp. MH-G8 TaxID=1854588 RepID=UPI00130453EC|nr:ATP-binding cassette domain-containing protein [Pseudonocardia sp. MH-G8]